MADKSTDDRPDDKILDTWIDGLAGRPTPSGKGEAWQAARIRRIVLAQQHQAEKRISDEDLDRGWERLRFRLAKEKLLTVGGGHSGWRLQAPLALAATIAAVAMGVFVTLSNLRQVAPGSDDAILWSAGEVEIPRGSVPRRRIKTAMPDEEARAFAGQLARAGVPFELTGDPDGQKRLLKIQLAGSAIPAEIGVRLSQAGVDVMREDVVYLEFSQSP